MPKSPSIRSFNEIKSLPEGYFGGSYTAIVTNTKPLNGKAGFGILVNPENPSDTIACQFWGIDPVKFTGATISFSGMGMKYSVYKDKPQVSVNEKTIIRAIGGTITAPAPVVEQPLQAGVAGIHAPRTPAPVPAYAPTSTANVDFNAEISKISALYAQAYNRACLLRDMYESTNNPFTEKLLETCTASIFISAERKGLANHLPAQAPVGAKAQEPVVQQAQDNSEDPF